MPVRRSSTNLTAGLAICICLVMIIVINKMFSDTSPCQLPKYDTLPLENIITKVREQAKEHDEIQKMALKVSDFMLNDDRMMMLKRKNELLAIALQDNSRSLELHKRTIKYLEETAKKNESLLKFQATTDLAFNKLEVENEPSIEDEQLKRRVLRNVEELHYSIEAKLSDLRSNKSATQIDTAITSLKNQLNAMMIDAEKLKSLNQEWSVKESLALQSMIRKRIHYIQNPKDCASARKLICNLNKRCGFGCQLHHLSYCMMIAYGSTRTLIVVSRNWIYNRMGWEAVFQPVSETCQKAQSRFPALMSDKNKDILEVIMPPADVLKHLPGTSPPTVPLNIPEDLAPRLKRLHGNPGVWWVGQFVRYIFRGQDWLEKELRAFEIAVNFSTPIVGVHVRRTDKIGTEAAFHAIEKYMVHVEQWYRKYDMKHEDRDGRVKKRVYLATDEPQVVKEARKKYPEYEIINFEAFSQTASNLVIRYSNDSLRGIVADIHLLSMCNYLVCTFSSQVCRVAYELMQTLHPDASAMFHSLDDSYYYGGGTARKQRVLYKHVPAAGSDEIDLNIGDVIFLKGNHWNGYSKGKNQRTLKVGLYPSWKVEDMTSQVPYPSYPEADKT